VLEFSRSQKQVPVPLFWSFEFRPFYVSARRLDQINICLFHEGKSIAILLHPMTRMFRERKSRVMLLASWPRYSNRY